jgi:hypothetical protein
VPHQPRATLHPPPARATCRTRFAANRTGATELAPFPPLLSCATSRAPPETSRTNATCRGAPGLAQSFRRDGSPLHQPRQSDSPRLPQPTRATCPAEPYRSSPARHAPSCPTEPRQRDSPPHPNPDQRDTPRRELARPDRPGATCRAAPGLSDRPLRAAPTQRDRPYRTRTGQCDMPDRSHPPPPRRPKPRLARIDRPGATNHAELTHARATSPTTPSQPCAACRAQPGHHALATVLPTPALTRATHHAIANRAVPSRLARPSRAISWRQAMPKRALPARRSTPDQTQATG